MIDDADGLLWTINAGCIDVHAPYARAQSFDSPDFVLFDLDPSPGVTLAQTGRVALLVRDALAALDLRAVVKTSSAEGMHLAVPLRPGHTYAQARGLVQVVAQALERANPGLVHDRVGQEPPPRRADRFQPGRLRAHDVHRLLRAAAPWRTRRRCR